MKKKYFTRIIRLILLIIPVIALASSCATTQPAIDSKDLSYLYNPSKNPLNPLYNVTNTSDDQSVLSVSFKSGELFFSEANPEGMPKSLMLITVKLFNMTQGRILADTAYYNLSILKDENNLEYIYNIPLKTGAGSEYVAEVKILDKLRSIVAQSFISFNTLSDDNRYNFRAQDHFVKNELFSPVVRVNDYVNLIYLKKPVDSLFISYYKPFSAIPDPPSMLLPQKTVDYDPERIVPLPYSDTLPMMFPKEGIYKCTTGRDISDGYTFFNFGPDFPGMTTPETMIGPLAYLATPGQLDSMRMAVKPKMALDEFWIKCGGNVDKSRELIRIYYTRVYFSNFYFTSFTEGWRTERGMIYIIYGPPDKVYKSNDGESWGYRKPVIKSSWGSRYKVEEQYLFFNFKKRSNIFSGNDYFLSRSESLVTLWDRAVNSWKKGIVFRLDNPEDF